MDSKKIKTIAIASSIILLVGIIYVFKNKKPTNKDNQNQLLAGNQLALELKKDIPFISDKTGISQTLISKGNSSFIISWYNALEEGNDTFLDNGIYYNSNNGERFS
jgi:hypothetical protein